MLVLVGAFILLIGLVSAIAILISTYRELKKEDKTSNKVLFVIVGMQSKIRDCGSK